MKCLRKTSVIISHSIWTESETYGEQNAYMIGDINIKPSSLIVLRTMTLQWLEIWELLAF
jgi:hypothetical protein